MRYLLAVLLLLLAPNLRAAERAIELSVDVRAPVAEVWRAWTTTEGVTSFFAPEGRVELRVDGPFELFFDPLAEPGAMGADGMRILAFQERKMLSFTWNAPPSLPEARKQRTHVVVRFEAVGDTVTTVTLHHDGWGTGGEWDTAFSYFSQAWPKVLANLKRRFASGPLDWSAWLEQMRATHKTK
jgi:uncharacterized protein YndB with AHSA1/START domain